MQFSVYEIVNKLNVMQEIIDKIEAGEIDTVWSGDIRDLLQEYSDILKSAKVKI